ncbi:hypothetical protein LUZ60_003375 [Juncus effusus]|nr:hypothetical protein LUZ60_003375 [Juncus effusus]
MAGEEEEEDYMGDLSQFVSPSENPSHVKNRPKHQHQPSSSNYGTGNKKGKIGKKKKGPLLSWQEKKRRERILKQMEEDELTKQSLDKPIPDSNVGFKLLQRMGYQPSQESMEPIGIEMRRSRAGLGVEEEKRRREKEEIEKKRWREEGMKEDFEETMRARFKIRKIRSDLRKAQAALDQLEKRDSVPEPKEEDEKEEEEEEIITQEDLDDILMKLRDEHNYCLYCGCQYETEEELTSSCPGPYEDNH